MTQALLEFDAAAASAVASGPRGLWRATLITPGQGSSGNWLEETIRRDGPHALKKGAKCFVTHNRMENGEPDPFTLWGTLAEDAWYEEGVGLVSNIQVLDSWIDKVAEVAPHTALSVFLMGESDEDGNITAILEDVQNGVDLVVYPGRPGSSLVAKMYESAIAGNKNDPPAVVVEETTTKGLLQMDQETKDAFAALNKRFDDLEAKNIAEVQAEVDEAEVAEKVEKGVEEAVAKIKDSVEAVQAAEADLLPSQAKSLYESAYKGIDVTNAIAEAKAIKVEAQKALVEAGTVVESGRLSETATEGYVLRGYQEAK